MPRVKIRHVAYMNESCHTQWTCAAILAIDHVNHRNASIVGCVEHVAVCCSVLQCVASYANHHNASIVGYVAVCCSVLHPTSIIAMPPSLGVLQYAAVCYNML